MNDLEFDPMQLLHEGERIPEIKSWLSETVWSSNRYESLSLEEYLRSGEGAVSRLEEIIGTGALQVWDELEAESRRSPTIQEWLGINALFPLQSPRAAVVFDGLSIREIPLIVKMAQSTGFQIKTVSAIGTSLPTETLDFIEQRVLGSRVAPSQLRGRRELAEKNVAAYYLEQANSREVFPADKSLLVWSSYPDRLFSNDEARDESLFSTFHRDHIPVLWKCAAQSIPSHMPIVITADHGYAFFGTGFDSIRQSDATALLGQARFKQFAEGESFPDWHPDLQLIKQTRTALLRGRLRVRPQGPSSRKLYQHGGFSLMEVLVPWIELERE